MGTVDQRDQLKVKGLKKSFTLTLANQRDYNVLAQGYMLTLGKMEPNHAENQVKRILLFLRKGD